MRKLTTEQFIEKAVEVHGSTYDYSKVEYKTAKTLVIIICGVHGDFEQIPNNHLAGKGCSLCANNVLKTTAEFITEAKNVHKDSYDYDKVIYKGKSHTIIITCPVHGDFEQVSATHLRGSGCPKCGYVTLSNKFSSNTEEFIVKAKQVHGNTYSYARVE